jgi:hypothetical protein
VAGWRGGENAMSLNIPSVCGAPLEKLNKVIWKTEHTNVPRHENFHVLGSMQFEMKSHAGSNQI